MKSISNNILKCNFPIFLKITIIASVILFSFALNLLLINKNLKFNLFKESGLFETMTALFFFICAFNFFLIFKFYKSIFCIILGIVFFIGFGEEISWGQRIFNFNTPEFMIESNMQKEMTLHNLELFNVYDSNGAQKTGIHKLLSTVFLYKMFWLLYGVLLPASMFFFNGISSMLSRLKILVPSFSIGIFFLFNWLCLKIISSFVFHNFENFEYFRKMWELDEVYECCTAFIFLMITFEFISRKKNLI